MSRVVPVTTATKIPLSRNIDVSLKAGGVLKERYYHHVNINSNGDEFRVHTKSLSCLLRALNERVFNAKNLKTGVQGAPTRPEKGHFKATLNYLRQRFAKHAFISKRLDHADYPGLFSGRKRALYQHAYEQFRVVGKKATDSMVKGFLKLDKFNFTRKADAVCRLIQPRSPSYNLQLGVFLKTLEHSIFDILAKMCNGPTVMKGYTNNVCGQIIAEAWESIDECVALPLDISRLDQHVSTEALQFEHSFYHLFFKGDDLKELKSLLKKQIHYKSLATCDEAVVKYSPEPMRCSGDNNTSLGNVIIVVMVTLHTILSYHPNAKFRIINNGDDCSILLSRWLVTPKFIQHVKDTFWSFGLPAVLEPTVYQLEKLVFCQSQPVKQAGKYTMVRTLRTALSKDLFAKKNFTSVEEYYSWLRAVGEGGARSNPGIPVLTEFYNMLYRMGMEHTTTPNRRYKGELENPYSIKRFSGRGHFAPYEPVRCSTESRVSSYLAFDLTTGEQTALEAEYRLTKSAKADLTHMAHTIFDGTLSGVY